MSRWGTPQVGEWVHLRVRGYNVNKTRCGVKYSSRYGTGASNRVTCKDCLGFMAQDVEVALSGQQLIHLYGPTNERSRCGVPVHAGFGGATVVRTAANCKRCLEADV